MKYVKLLRVKHYIKNILVFIPLFFGQEILARGKFVSALLGAVAFCFISSAVYIINDLQDADKDRLHPMKRERPIACGTVSRENALVVFFLCFVSAIIFTVLTGKPFALLYVMGYFGINMLYSYGLKNKPLIDIFILASGFVIRIFYGGFLTGTTISTWLYLVIMAGALCMGIGKRREEKKRIESTREVLKYYSYSFLDKQMYVCITLSDVFYALWAMEASGGRLKWTIPLFFAILMRYSFDVESSCDGDPVEVITSDKVLVCMLAVYGLYLFFLLYL